MSTYEEVREIKEKYEAALLEKDGVVGVGIGRKRDSGLFCIRIYLSRQLDPDNAIPSSLDGVDVDIVYTGPIKSQ